MNANFGTVDLEDIIQHGDLSVFFLHLSKDYEKT